MSIDVITVISDDYFYIQGVIADNESYVSCFLGDSNGKEDLNFNHGVVCLVRIRQYPLLIAVLQRLIKECSCPVFIDYATPDSVAKVVTIGDFYLIFDRLSSQELYGFISSSLLKPAKYSFSAAHASPAEWRVLGWILNDVNNRCIARKLNMTIKTVSHHKVRLANKMHLPEVNTPTLIKMMRVIFYLCLQDEHTEQLQKVSRDMIKTGPLIHLQ